MGQKTGSFPVAIPDSARVVAAYVRPIAMEVREGFTVIYEYAAVAIGCSDLAYGMNELLVRRCLRLDRQAFHAG